MGAELYTNFEHFTLIFYTAIEDRLEVAKSLPKKELAGHFDAISEDFHKLHRLVSDADVHLASYDLKTSQEVRICWFTFDVIIFVSNSK